MLNGKLIQLLQTLSKKELKDFRSFVATDYHNPNRHLEKFIGLLAKYEDDFSNPKLEKEVFFKKHYPGEKFDEQKIRYLQSDLTKLLEEFISYTEFRKDRFQQQLYLTQSLQRRNAPKFFLTPNLDFRKYLRNVWLLARSSVIIVVMVELLVNAAALPVGTIFFK
jgi:hypothetical protein